jgi:hypothetical protein
VHVFDSCGNVLIWGFPYRWLVPLKKRGEIWKNEHVRSHSVVAKQSSEAVVGRQFAVLFQSCKAFKLWKAQW